AKLKSKKETIDRTIIKLHESGAIANKTEGLSRTIKIQNNPPSCQVLIPTQDLPEEYRYEKVEVKPDKKAITQAWKQGIEVEGTEVFQKQRVVYGLSKDIT
ncbi:siphovirus Gp157 family protein, partial [Pleurocapsales cyanobacterium LEGE 10410]|nr:siphovirus Gp157 family protein [Pleurocapsales cyanobacterium LEGE 10410]